MERIKGNPRMTAVFDELVMDSRSIGEGFLSYNGIEINKELQTRQYDFEVISNEEGSYIAKLNGNGMAKKLSTYFSEEEAKDQLVRLNTYIQVEQQKERNKDIGAEPSIEFMELSEKD
ncbi:hypothetical protein [Bacillus sp. EB600]|uniref:hypothetical protein n=1 Tax=Bacillus sp. EB600 TaxID=2806345 RepID=UPI00210E9984|nr:hypothetical protein [Bacillus sp. EB600]MCQ6281819.1 hypothetical protein [Bacillus sp. EB600]